MTMTNPLIKLHFKSLHSEVMLNILKDQNFIF